MCFKNKIGAQRVKPPTPTWTSDALVGDEEQNRKQKKEEKQGMDPPNSATQDKLVASYGTHGSYGMPSLKPPHTQGKIYYYYY